MLAALLFTFTAMVGEGAVKVDNIHWLGHATFRIEDGRTQIYLDPWKLPPASPKADVILITHSHYDHYSADDIAKIEQPSTLFVAPADVAAKLKGKRVTTASAGGTYKVDALTVQAVAAYNTNKDFHKKSSGWVGYLVTLSNGVRVYHSGDSDVTPEMKAVQTDVALLPCGGTYTMTAAEVAQAANAFKPAILIPMHWGDIVGSQADADTVAREFTSGKTVIRPVER